MWGALTILKVAVLGLATLRHTNPRELRARKMLGQRSPPPKSSRPWSVITNLQGGCRAGLAARQLEPL
jgi:hypothetical protein